MLCVSAGFSQGFLPIAPSTFSAEQYFKSQDSIFTYVNDSSEGGEKAEYLRFKNFAMSRMQLSKPFYGQGDPAYSVFDNNGCNFILDNVCNNPDPDSKDISVWKQIEKDKNETPHQGIISCIWSTNASATNKFILAGGYKSGLWKSTDDGLHWINLTDKLHLTSMGVSSIAVDPNNNMRIWIATEREILGGFGIYFTNDGGVNWCHQTLPGNLNWVGLSEAKVHKIMLDPSDASNNSLVCITDYQVFSTKTGGVFWTGVTPNMMNTGTSKICALNDFVFNPLSANEIYLTTRPLGDISVIGQSTLLSMQNIYNNTNGSGTNFFGILAAEIPPLNVPEAGAMKMAINNSGLLFLSTVYAKNGILSNVLMSFNKTPLSGAPKFLEITTDNVNNGFIGLAMDFEPNSNPTNLTPNFYLGGSIGLKFLSFTTLNNWAWQDAKGGNSNETHVDARCLYSNNSTSTIFLGHDGGISKTTKTATSWTNINGDLNNADVGGMSVSENDGTIGFSKNHNWSWVKNKEIYKDIIGGDGYLNRFEKNYKVKNVGYFGMNYGWMGKYEKNNFNNFYFSGWIDYTHANFDFQTQNNSSSNFGSIFFLKNDFGTAPYINKYKLIKLDDYTRTIAQDVASFPTSDEKIIKTYAVSESNPNTIYMAIWDKTITDPFAQNKLYKTTVGNFLTPNSFSVLPFAETHHVSTICIDPENANRLWVGFGESEAEHELNIRRVYYSEDGGNTFLDISKGLPRFAVNKLKYDYQSRYLYAATDIGVYFYNTTVSEPIIEEEWHCFNKDMPAVMITDMEINHCTNKLYASTSGRGIWNSELPNNDFLNEYDDKSTFVIPDLFAITFNESVNYDKTIIIKKGGQLVIEGTIANPITINMARHRAIIVEPGGSLVIKNAKVTNECGTMWSGIRVLGNPNYAHPIMPGVLTTASAKDPAKQQGVLWMSNAKIENAHFGIATYGIVYKPCDDFPYAGGNVTGGIIVVENNSEINNCFVGVDISPYGTPHRSKFLNSKFNSNQYLDNKMYTQKYTFDNTDRRYGTIIFLQTSTVTGIRIENCEFNNTSAIGTSFDEPVDFYPEGIGSYDASLRINNNIFRKCNYGIDMVCSPLSMAKSTITNNTMTNTWRGIHVAGVNNWHQIQFNNISLTYNENNSIGNINACNGVAQNNAWGIYDDNSIGVSITDNNISYAPNYMANVEDENYGIIISNSSPLNTGITNVVRRNSINNLRYGIIAIGDNKRAQMTCNKFFNNMDLDFSTVSNQIVNFGIFHNKNNGCNPIGDGLLQSPQGSCSNNNTTPAGNQFPSCNGLATPVNHYFIEANVPIIKYNEHTNAPYLAEPCISNNLAINQCNLTNCATYSVCCADSKVLTKSTWTPGDYKGQIAFLQTQVGTKSDLIDGGDRETLISAINNPNYNSAYLMQTLLDAGNYLSDDILIATINRSVNQLTNYDLKTVLIFNSPLSETVFESLSNTRPTVAYNYTVYMAQQSGISPIENLKGEINTLESEKDEEIASLVDLYLAQNLLDSAANILAINGKIQAAIAMYAQMGNYSDAQVLINGLEDADLKSVYNINLNSLNNNIPLAQLATQDFETLDAIKNNYTNSGVYANNMLRFTGVKKQNEQLPNFSAVNTSPRKKQHEIFYSEILPEQNFSIYPNPASNTLNVINYNYTLNKNCTLIIYDIMGKQVLAINLNNDKNKTIISLAELNTGIYNYKISDGNILKLNDKLIITK
jgi:Secretion system C-terminal sorting domain